MPGSARVALGLGTVLALIATLPVWRDPNARFVGSDYDPSLFAWFLRWLPHAVAEGQSPLFSDAANLPAGVNLAWNTAMPLPAALLAPVTTLAGPVASYNVLIALCIAGNVVAAFALSRRLCSTAAGAYIAAFAVATSPFIAAQGLGHPHLAFIAFPLVIGALLHDVITGRLPARRAGVVLGAAGVAQAFIGLEMIAMTAIALVVMVGWTAIARRDALARHLRPLAQTVTWGVLVAAPALAAPAAVFLSGPQRIDGSIHPPGYHLDVLNLVAASTASAPSFLVQPSADELSSNVFESTGFILPLAIAAIVTRRGWRAHQAAAPLLALSVSTLLLALGTSVHVAGRDLDVPGPWAVFAGLPLLENVLPVRLTVFSQIALALLVGVGLPSTWRVYRGPWTRRALVASLTALVVIAGLPRWPMRSHAVMSAPDVFRRGDVVQMAQHPLFDTRPMLWQAQSGYAWKLYDAYLVTPELQQFLRTGRSRVPCLGGQTAQPCPPDLGAALAQHGITIVVVPPGPTHDGFVREIRRVLGPVSRSGETSYWRIG